VCSDEVSADSCLTCRTSDTSHTLTLRLCASETAALPDKGRPFLEHRDSPPFLKEPACSRER
jgi:hypothetical protein